MPDRNIRVNAVAPGTIRTDRVQRLPEEPGGTEYIAAIERMHPMGRLCEPPEVAQAILFLASDEASFITGAILPVDGGYRAQRRDVQLRRRPRHAVRLPDHTRLIRTGGSS
jgi:NAD(P)-dependent dehydrogenase (short-subunit alcohol dehydrogenase family)